MGRPSDYTAEIGELICERLICGKDNRPESLRSICSDESMPDLRKVMRWLATNADFRQQYAQARELQQELNHEEILEIADNSTDDVHTITIDREDGEINRLAINHSAIARARLQVDTRKWLMSKMAPKKYGEKQEVTIPGIESITDDKLESKLAHLLGKAGIISPAEGKGEAEES